MLSEITASCLTMGVAGTSSAEKIAPEWYVNAFATGMHLTLVEHQISDVYITGSSDSHHIYNQAKYR